MEIKPIKNPTKWGHRTETIMSGSTKNKKYIGPYASLREYLEALEKFGRVLHINDIDQDQYEATGFIYRLMEKYSAVEAPVVSFDPVSYTHLRAHET